MLNFNLKLCGVAEKVQNARCLSAELSRVGHRKCARIAKNERNLSGFSVYGSARIAQSRRYRLQSIIGKMIFGNRNFIAAFLRGEAVPCIDRYTARSPTEPGYKRARSGRRLSRRFAAGQCRAHAVRFMYWLCARGRCASALWYPWEIKYVLLIRIWLKLEEMFSNKLKITLTILDQIEWREGSISASNFDVVGDRTVHSSP